MQIENIGNHFLGLEANYSRRELNKKECESLKQPMNLGIDLMNDLSEVFRVF